MKSLHAQGHKYPWMDQLKMSHLHFLDPSKFIKYREHLNEALNINEYNYPGSIDFETLMI